MLIKERIENYGAKSLFDHEALHVLTGISMEQLEKFKDLNDIRNRRSEMKITSNQKNKLELFFELSMRLNKASAEKMRISAPKDIYNAIKWRLPYMDKEVFMIAMLDTKSKLIGIEDISVGSLTASIIHPREVFKPAIVNSAYSIVAIHNHPSNDTTPSQEDISVTKRLIEVGENLGIQMVDHIIIGANGFTSMVDSHYI